MGSIAAKTYVTHMVLGKTYRKNCSSTPSKPRRIGGNI